MNISTSKKVVIINNLNLNSGSNTNLTVTIKGLNIADLYNSNFVYIVQEIHDSASR